MKIREEMVESVKIMEIEGNRGEISRDMWSNVVDIDCKCIK